MNNGIKKFLEEKIVWPIFDVFDKVKCFFGLHSYISDLDQYARASQLILVLCKLKPKMRHDKVFEGIMERCDFACLWCGHKKKRLK